MTMTMDQDDIEGAGGLPLVLAGINRGFREGEGRLDILRDANAASLRWMRPNDVVTMDYRRDRINVKLSNDIVVTGFSCG